MPTSGGTISIIRRRNDNAGINFNPKLVVFPGLGGGHGRRQLSFSAGGGPIISGDLNNDYISNRTEMDYWEAMKARSFLSSLYSLEC